jgi:hypothetical protein
MKVIEVIYRASISRAEYSRKNATHLLICAHWTSYESLLVNIFVPQLQECLRCDNRSTVCCR